LAILKKAGIKGTIPYTIIPAKIRKLFVKGSSYPRK
jgi:hypothetical protein